MKRLAIVLLIIACCCMVVGCGKSKNNQALVDALASLQKLKASTEIGVSYVQYGPLLIDAKAKINSVSPQIQNSELKNEFEGAITSYEDAYELMDIVIQVPIYKEMDTIMANVNNTDSTSVRVIGLVSKYGGGDVVDLGGRVKQIKLTLLSSKIWAEANNHVERIALLLK